jgi:hypothetical protein
MSKVRNHAKLVLILVALAFSGAALTACDNEGPMEKAGAKADEAVHDAKRAVKDAAD